MCKGLQMACVCTYVNDAHITVILCSKKQTGTVFVCVFVRALPCICWWRQSGHRVTSVEGSFCTVWPNLVSVFLTAVLTYILPIVFIICFVLCMSPPKFNFVHASFESLSVWILLRRMQPTGFGTLAHAKKKIGLLKWSVITADVCTCALWFGRCCEEMGMPYFLRSVAGGTSRAPGPLAICNLICSTELNCLVRCWQYV